VGKRQDAFETGGQARPHVGPRCEVGPHIVLDPPEVSQILQVIESEITTRDGLDVREQRLGD